MTQQQQLDSNKQFFYKKIFKKSLNICICQNTNTKYIDISDGLLNYKKVYINYIVLFFKRTIGNLCVCVCVLPQRLSTKKKKKKKNPPAVQESQKTWVLSLGWEDPLEEGMVTHCNILTWRIPWKEKLDGLWSKELQRVRQSNNILKKSYTMTKWALSRECKDSLISANQSTRYTTLTN